MDHRLRVPYNVEKVGGIYKTFDYDLFKPAFWNRPLRQRHVRSIVESIRKHNYLDAVPILVNFEMQIIDGQHRHAAAKYLRLALSYFQLDIPDGDKWLIMSGASRRSTQIKDTINYYVKKEGDENFKLLEDLIDFTGLPTGCCCALLGDYIGKQAGNNIRHGELNFKHDQQTLERICRLFLDVKKIVDLINEKKLTEIMRTVYFCRGLHDFIMLDLDWKQFIDHFEKHWEFVSVYFKTASDYKKRFIDIYNQGKLKKNRFVA